MQFSANNLQNNRIAHPLRKILDPSLITLNFETRWPFTSWSLLPKVHLRQINCRLLILFYWKHLRWFNLKSPEFFPHPNKTKSYLLSKRNLIHKCQFQVIIYMFSFKSTKEHSKVLQRRKVHWVCDLCYKSHLRQLSIEI